MFVCFVFLGGGWVMLTQKKCWVDGNKLRKVTTCNVLVVLHVFFRGIWMKFTVDSQQRLCRRVQM